MKRLPLLLTAALMLLLAACSEPPASPELTGQWAGTAGGVPLEFEIEPGGHVYENSFVLTHNGETLSVDVDSHATGNTIRITVLATHSNGDSLEFVLNGSVNGDTLSGDYRLTLVVSGERSEVTGNFTLTRAPEA